MRLQTEVRVEHRVRITILITFPEVICDAVKVTQRPALRITGNTNKLTLDKSSLKI